MTLQTYEYRHKPDPNKVRCPICRGMGSGMNGSFYFGTDSATGEVVRGGTRDVCDYCGGTGWINRCTHRGGTGGTH
jgi:hypothetical protein